MNEHLVETPTSKLLRQKRKSSRKNRFLKGKVPMDWLHQAADEGKAALAVGIMLWHQKGLVGRDNFAVSIRYLTLGTMHKDTVRRGIESLEDAELIKVERHFGRKSTFTLLYKQDKSLETI